MPDIYIRIDDASLASITVTCGLHVETVECGMVPPEVVAMCRHIERKKGTKL